MGIRFPPPCFGLERVKTMLLVSWSLGSKGYKTKLTEKLCWLVKSPLVFLSAGKIWFLLVYKSFGTFQVLKDRLMMSQINNPGENKSVLIYWYISDYYRQMKKFFQNKE